MPPDIRRVRTLPLPCPLRANARSAHCLARAREAEGAREVKPGDEFRYVFDLGDNWRHRCVVERDTADPLEGYRHLPPRPVPVWGWGWIPDQYGRERLVDDEE